MTRVCTACRHPERQAIDKAIVEGEPHRSIAKRHGLTAASLYRHSCEHVAELMAKAKAAEQVTADSLLSHVCDLRKRAMGILDKAEKAESWPGATGALREARECIRLLGELYGKLQAGGTINVLVSPDWQAAQIAILRALQPFPEARIAVVKALQPLSERPRLTSG